MNAKEIKNIFIKLIKKTKEDNISEYAAEAAYFSIISFIPFAAIFFTLIKFTKIDKNTIFYIINEIIPSNISSTLLDIIEEIYSKPALEISFSLLIIIWSSGKGFFSLSKGIKNIYNINVKNNFILRITGSIYTFLLEILIILFLTLIVLGKTIYIAIMKKYYQISFIISILYRFRIFFLIFLMTMILYFLYKIITIKNIRKTYHICGAIFCACVWQILSYGLSIYIKYSNSISNFYGSLSSFILIMLWIYFSMYIILLGAEINFLISNLNEK